MSTRLIRMNYDLINVISLQVPNAMKGDNSRELFKTKVFKSLISDIKFGPKDVSVKRIGEESSDQCEVDFSNGKKFFLDSRGVVEMHDNDFIMSFSGIDEPGGNGFKFAICDIAIFAEEGCYIKHAILEYDNNRFCWKEDKSISFYDLDAIEYIKSTEAFNESSMGLIKHIKDIANSLHIQPDKYVEYSHSFDYIGKDKFLSLLMARADKNLALSDMKNKLERGKKR